MELYKFTRKYKLSTAAVINFIRINAGDEKANKYSKLSIVTQKNLCLVFNARFKIIKPKVDLSPLQEWSNKAKNQNNSRTVIGVFNEKKFESRDKLKFIINTPAGGQSGYRKRFKRK